MGFHKNTVYGFLAKVRTGGKDAVKARAPIGQTPVVRGTGARYSVNMLSAVPVQGKLRFMVHEGTVNSQVFIDFCQRLLRDADSPVYLIVDGHSSHKSKGTKKFVANTKGR